MLSHQSLNMESVLPSTSIMTSSSAINSLYSFSSLDDDTRQGAFLIALLSSSRRQLLSPTSRWSQHPSSLMALPSAPQSYNSICILTTSTCLYSISPNGYDSILRKFPPYRSPQNVLTKFCQVPYSHHYFFSVHSRCRKDVTVLTYLP